MNNVVLKHNTTYNTIQYNAMLAIQYNTIQLWHLYTKLYKLEYSHMKQLQ